MSDPNTVQTTEATSQPQKNQPNETLSILERAEKLNADTRAAEERMAKHKQEIEMIETKRIMGGTTHAGSISKTPEELKKEEAGRIASDIVNAFKRP